MSTARIPDGTPLGLVQLGLPQQPQVYCGPGSHPGQTHVRRGVPPMLETERERAKRTKTMPWKWQRCSKCGRQCDRRGHGRDGLRQCPNGGAHRPEQTPGPKGCGGVQHREIKSAGQTTGGACGGSRLGNPSDGDGLTR